MADLAGLGVAAVIAQLTCWLLLLPDVLGGERREKVAVVFDIK